jgi:repressor LexA
MLTDRQRELLEYLQNYVSREQRFPSYREMAKAMGVSAVGTIQDHIQALIDNGSLEKDGRKLKLAQNRQVPVLTVPIVGEVAAGALQDAFEVALGAITITPDMMRERASSQDLFALRVRGESMIEAGIHPGDLLVIHKQARVRNGDFVVVDYEGEATVKEIEMPKNKSAPVRLIPHNATMSPIEVFPSEKLRILGKVVSVQRFYN